MNTFDTHITRRRPSRARDAERIEPRAHDLDGALRALLFMCPSLQDSWRGAAEWASVEAVLQLGRDLEQIRSEVRRITGASHRRGRRSALRLNV